MALPAITNNSPAGGITWAAFTIQYQGVAYSIGGGSTTQRWVWWRYNGGSSVIEAGAEIPSNLTDDDLVLFANKNGIGVRVQSTSFVDGELLVDGSIFAEALSTNLINSDHIVTAGLDAAVIKFGEMSGDRIAVNSLSGDTLIGRTVAASKLLVADFNNYFEDPRAEYGDYNGSFLKDDTQNPPNGGSAFVNTFGFSGSAQETIAIPAKQNDEFVVEYDIKTVLGNSGSYLGLYQRPSGTACTTISSQTIKDYGDGWTRVRRVLRAHIAGTTRVNPLWSISHPSPYNTTKAAWSDIYILKRRGGELIIDGTIQSSHVVTEGLDAAVIKFGEMSGERITVNTINSDHVVTEGLDAGIIKFGEMDGDRITANTITAEQLATEVILATSSIVAKGPEGQTVEMTGQGFFVRGPDSEGNPAYVSFPTTVTAGKPNIIGGELNATVLTVEGDPTTRVAATFRRDSRFEPGSTLTLNDTTPGPSGTLTLESGTDISAISGSYATERPNNLTWVSAGCWYNGKYYYIVASPMGGPSVFGGTVIEYTPSTKSAISVGTIAGQYMTRPLGITRVPGTDGWRVLWASWTQRPTLYLAKHADSDFAMVGSMQSIGLVNSTNDYYADAVGIGTDGTDIWVGSIDANYASNNAAPRYRRYLGTLANVNVQETITDSTRISSRTTSGEFPRINGIHVGNMDFGAKRVVSMIQSRDGYNYHRVITSAGATAEEFSEMMGTSSRAFTSWDGVRMWDYSPAGKSLAKYSKVLWSSKEQALSGWYAFYQSSPSAMTPLSNTVFILHKSRYWIKATGTTPPENLVNRIYLNTTISSGTSHLQSTLGAGVLGATYDTYLSTGAAPSVGGFGSAIPAQVKSQATKTITLSGLTSASGSAYLTADTPLFRPWMVGQTVTGPTIQSGTTVLSVNSDRKSLQMSKTASASSSGGATASFANQPKLLFQGDSYARIGELETLIISSTSEATTGAGNEPPLRVGDITGDHLRLDGNEIISMDDDATRGPLTVRASVSTFDVDNGGLSILSSGSVAGAIKTIADNGTRLNFAFNRIIAQTATSSGATVNANTTVGFHAADIHSWSGGIFMEDLATGGSGGANINNAGRIVRAGSKRSLKDDIRPMTIQEAMSILDVTPSTFKWIPELDMGDYREGGWIAEEVAEVAPLWATYDQEGVPTGVHYDRITAALALIIREKLLPQTS